MRVRLSVAVAALLYGTLALADGTKLGDGSLDNITAGNAGSDPLIASGGAVVGNNSQATIKITGTLDFSGQAQSGASGLNVVNSSESTVANGVNVWDGQLKNPATGTGGVGEQREYTGSTAKFEVNQSNNVEQEQRRVAFLPDYERTEANTSRTWTDNSTKNLTTSHNSSNQQMDVQETSHSRELTSSGSVTTESVVAGQTIRGGRGIAGAGDLHVNFDGGNIDFTAGIKAGGSGGLDGDLHLNIELPELAIDFNGGGCAVQMGSCEGNGTLSEADDAKRDNSHTETVADTSEEHSTSSSTGTEDVRSPFQIHGAQAEYVVVDDSKLDVDSNYGVTLSGSAQSNLRALNAVNSAGSAVANAVNISRTPSFTSSQTLALNQENVIKHSR